MESRNDAGIWLFNLLLLHWLWRCFGLLNLLFRLGFFNPLVQCLDWIHSNSTNGFRWSSSCGHHFFGLLTIDSQGLCELGLLLCSSFLCLLGCEMLDLLIQGLLCGCA